MINETLTGSDTSATTVPTESVSEFSIVGTGRVILEMLPPSGSTWITLSNSMRKGSLSTPDPAVTYRFRSVNATSVTCVFGP